MSATSNSTDHQTSDGNHHGVSSNYTFWTWLIAVIAIIYLVWAWQHNRGPSFSNACCTANTAIPAVTTAAPFNFNASVIDGYTATGDASNVSWATKSNALIDWLKTGSDFKVTGDAAQVTLTGTVADEASKTTKGSEAQAFFGDKVLINNQLSIAPPAAIIAEQTKPEITKIYFAVGSNQLPTDAEQMLTPIVEWIHKQPSTKVKISGFHDVTGSQATNEAISKDRAKAIYSYLVNAGVNAENIELVKPENIEGGADLNEARRVEITLQ